MNRYGFSNEQAEAIVTMPLYKLSHTDEVTLSLISMVMIGVHKSKKSKKLRLLISVN